MRDDDEHEHGAQRQRERGHELRALMQLCRAVKIRMFAQAREPEPTEHAAAKSKNDGGEREDLYDLVRVVSTARDEDVEGANDRFARVACFLQGGLEPVEERLEPFAGGVAAECLQLWMR